MSLKSSFLFIIIAGTPATTQFSGTFLTTTALAPTTEPVPITIPPIIFAPALIVTLSSIIGQLSLLENPTVTC